METNLVHFLEELGAGRVRHSRRTLLAHLVGVATILERWGAPDRVWKAGLFHSVYGTEYFKDSVLPFDARPLVRERIGEDAERLAWIFCAFDRGSLYRAIDRGAPYEIELLKGAERHAVTEREIADLVWLVWANALEQVPHLKPKDEERARSRKSLARVARFLPEQARRELAETYGAPAVQSPGMPTPSLRALFALDDVTPFMKSFPEKLFIGKGPVERLAGLVDYDLADLVKMKRAFTRAFFRTLDGKSTSVKVAAGQEKELYDAGFTIYFHSLRGPCIDKWVEAIEKELDLVPGVTRVSAFASRRGLGLKPHYDMNDNFVCQARGVKRWRIAPNTHVKHPTVGYTVGNTPNAKQAAEAPNGFPTGMPEPYETIEMRAGTVMFMPRGMWHDTETLDEASLHFNIQSGLATWKDALEFVLLGTPALHAEQLRDPLIVERGPGFQDALKEKLRQLVDAITTGDIPFDREEFQRYVAKRRSSA